MRCKPKKVFELAATWALLSGLKKYAALQTAGEITVKRSRPVEKYRQIYYMTHFHKNQDVIFNIYRLTGAHRITQLLTENCPWPFRIWRYRFNIGVNLCNVVNLRGSMTSSTRKPRINSHLRQYFVNALCRGDPVWSPENQNESYKTKNHHWQIAKGDVY